MNEQTLAELANDPVMGRAIREIAHTLEQSGTRVPTDHSNNNGDSGNSGMPTDNLRARDITQDRPSPYTLSTPTPVLAGDQALTKEAGNLGWHADLARDCLPEKSGQGVSKEALGQITPSQTPQQAEHTREPHGRGR